MRVTMRRKEDGSGASGGGGGLGCLTIPLWIMVIAVLVGAYYYSQGMDPRQAVGIGLETGVRSVGYVCGGIACLILGVLGFVAVGATWPKRY